MPVGSSGDASKLLHAFQEAFGSGGFADGEDPYNANHFKLESFEHNGKKIQGLSISKDIKEGDSVMVLPVEFTSQFKVEPMREERFGDLKNDPDAQMAFYLAEKKAELVDHPAGSIQLPWWDYVAQWIKTLPTMNELRAQGVPLAAPEEDLHRLQGLPHLDSLAQLVEEQKASLQAHLVHFNNARGHHAKLSLDDVLWGLAVGRLHNLTFFKVHGRLLVPGMDSLMNLSGGDGSNVRWVLDKASGLVECQATKDIHKGDELIGSYSNGHAVNGLDVIGKYGVFLPDAKVASWNNEDCAVLQKEDFGHADGKMLQNLGALVEHNCKELEVATTERSMAPALHCSLLNSWMPTSSPGALRTSGRSRMVADFL